jgi:hypothetical protein
LEFHNHAFILVIVSVSHFYQVSFIKLLHGAKICLKPSEIITRVQMEMKGYNYSNGILTEWLSFHLLNKWYIKKDIRVRVVSSNSIYKSFNFPFHNYDWNYENVQTSMLYLTKLLISSMKNINITAWTRRKMTKD